MITDPGRLPYTAIWALDFEFNNHGGKDWMNPVCMAAEELFTGRHVRMWLDGGVDAAPPFPIDDQTLFVGWFASAEWGCFLPLNWKMPTRIIDLHNAFRMKYNDGRKKEKGFFSLLNALDKHNICTITREEKEDMRALVLRGGPFSDTEQRAILDYCTTDVTPLLELSRRMLPRITRRPKGFGQALLRGRYTAAIARMLDNGIPIDTAIAGRLARRWDDIKLELIRAVDKDYGLFDGTVFKKERFAKYIVAHGFEWPRTEKTEAFKQDADTWRDMAERYPEVATLAELQSTLDGLRAEKLRIHSDGRHRPKLYGQFGTLSGRNAPTRFIFQQAAWWRGLIKPAPGQAIGYLDWKNQEITIAAVLSGDATLLEVALSTDPYVEFGKLAELIPPDGTSSTHPAERALCKTAMLATNYGQGAKNLAARVGLSERAARQLLGSIRREFPVFTAWAEQVVDRGRCTGRLATRLGWEMRVIESARTNTLRNFLVQSSGAELMRLAACLVTERGIRLCATVHDALLVEGPVGEIDAVVAATRRAMDEASAALLGGVVVRVDVVITRWPDRFSELPMWGTVLEILDRLD